MVSSTNPGTRGYFILDIRICPGFFNYLFDSWDNLTKKKIFYHLSSRCVLYLSISNGTFVKKA